jgi:putative membrane protein
MHIQRNHLLIFITIVAMLLLVISGIRPYDRTTWLLEVFPIFVVLPVLITTYRKFPLTNLLYALIFIHAVVLMVGGAYTYARVPLGFYLADILHLSRNPYDKIGHFFQGLVPALVARELFVRQNYINGKKIIAFIVVCVVLAISASYELIEWASALMLGQGADEFLGTQGDPWDTQSDMFFALIGSIVALSVFSRLHNREITKIMRNRTT